MDMNEVELYETIGGVTCYTSSSFLNAASRLISVLLSFGQVCGTIIRKSTRK